jgi:hypothetical protein
MTIRDIIDLSKLIDNKIELGLELNSSIFYEFEKKLNIEILFLAKV